VGKDVKTMFRALKDVPDAFLIHGGAPGWSTDLTSTNLVQEYGMQERAIIRNYYIPEEEKPYYFFAADAVILSYTKQFESTASLFWEACRFGIPIIASDNGQHKKLVEAFKPGLLFTAQNADSLRETIIYFINLNSGEIQIMKDNCRRFSDEFSMEKWAQGCLEIYDNLLTK
jgi:glycosyltransferase involved in cell wall biosynthesis